MRRVEPMLAVDETGVEEKQLGGQVPVAAGTEAEGRRREV
jgi:hypothetical protein